MIPEPFRAIQDDLKALSNQKLIMLALSLAVPGSNDIVILLRRELHKRSSSKLNTPGRG